MQRQKLLLGLKQLALFGAVLGLVFGTGAVSFDNVFADGKDKIEICHKGKTIEVSEKSLKGHLKHGDTEGECDDDDDKGHGKGKFKHVFRGDGPPPEKLGKIGDLYFDTSDGGCMDFWVKIDKKEWEHRGTLCDESLIMINWDQINVSTVPQELLEFAELDDCADGEIIRNESGTWQCSEDEKVESLDEIITCENDNEIAKFDTDTGKWFCAVDEDGADTLEELITCQDDEILRFDTGTGTWICDTPNVVIETTLLEDGDSYAGEEGQSTTYEPLGPNDQLIIQLTCSSGLVSGFNVNTQDAPVSVTPDTLNSLNGGQGIEIEVHNHGITVNDDGDDFIIKSLDTLEFVLFCVS